MQVKSVLSSKSSLQLRHLQLNTIKEEARIKRGYLTSNIIILFARTLAAKH
jgi:hypothetical protein